MVVQQFNWRLSVPLSVSHKLHEWSWMQAQSNYNWPLSVRSLPFLTIRPIEVPAAMDVWSLTCTMPSREGSLGQRFWRNHRQKLWNGKVMPCIRHPTASHRRNWHCWCFRKQKSHRSTKQWNQSDGCDRIFLRNEIASKQTKRYLFWTQSINCKGLSSIIDRIWPW